MYISVCLLALLSNHLPHGRLEVFRKFLFFLCITFFATASFAEEAPDALIRRLTEEVLTVVRNDKELQLGNTRRAIELIDQKVLPHFNFKHMTALALAKNWTNATEEQQRKLTQEFKMLLVRTYSNALTGYRNQTVRFKPSKAEGDEALVRSEIVQPGGHPIALNYSLEKDGGEWKVFDVTIDGISLVTSYRGQFTQEIRLNGIDGLIKAMSEKNRSSDPSIMKTR